MKDIASIIFLLLTILAYLATASWASRGVANKESYLLGNRQFGIFSITTTLIATQVGAGMIFGTAMLAYNDGILGISYVLGMVLGLVALGLGVGARFRSLEISTAAELFESKYNSVILRKIASVVSILTMGGILAAQIVASRQLFISLFKLNPLWLVIFWLMVIAYTTFGGLKAIIATDILQVIVIVIVFIAALFYIIPINNIVTNININQVHTDDIMNYSFLSSLLAPALFSLMEQDLAQRCFAAKTKKVATISSLLAAGFILIFALIPTSLGIYAQSLGIIVHDGESPLVLLCQAKLPTLGMTMVACALLAAICSTADSVLGAASTNLIADFLPTNSKFSLNIARMLTMMVGIVALTIAFNFNDVIGVLIKSYEISIAALFIPTMAALFIKAPQKQAAILAIISGSLIWLIGIIFNLTSATLLAVIISAMVFCLRQVKK